MQCLVLTIPTLFYNSPAGVEPVLKHVVGIGAAVASWADLVLCVHGMGVEGQYEQCILAFQANCMWA